MRLLLDTQVLLWWLADDPRLAQAHRAAISDTAVTALVSAVSVAEVSLKASLGKLDAPQDVAAHVLANGFPELPFTSRHAQELRDLPWHHRDPFDRMLIAQARADDLLLAAADTRCREYDVRLL